MFIPSSGRTVIQTSRGLVAVPFVIPKGAELYLDRRVHCFEVLLPACDLIYRVSSWPVRFHLPARSHWMSTLKGAQLEAELWDGQAVSYEGGMRHVVLDARRKEN